ncbi:MAG: hypothetical protein LM580_11740 [Thermofilum sp.]|nr:hypothetical protein [Thermofilum sp.]
MFKSSARPAGRYLSSSTTLKPRSFAAVTSSLLKSPTTLTLCHPKFAALFQFSSARASRWASRLRASYPTTTLHWAC